jgi:hypothetical protein
MTMEQIAIKKLKVLHDRNGRILAAIHDEAAPGMPVLGIVPARGQVLTALEVPAAHQARTMGQLFSRLQVRSGRVIVNDQPLQQRSSKIAKSGGKSKSRGRKKR